MANFYITEIKISVNGADSPCFIGGENVVKTNGNRVVNARDGQWYFLSAYLCVAALDLVVLGNVQFWSTRTVWEMRTGL